MTYSSIRDNHGHGTAGDFLKEQMKTRSDIEKDDADLIQIIKA
ncbi:MAG: hypothetical protein PHY54_02015 [Methylococcales bacterium]|nr:hypothetical protein [Methylococcales bacterium]